MSFKRSMFAFTLLLQSIFAFCNNLDFSWSYWLMVSLLYCSHLLFYDLSAVTTFFFYRNYASFLLFLWLALLLCKNQSWALSPYAVHNVNFSFVYLCLCNIFLPKPMPFLSPFSKLFFPSLGYLLSTFNCTMVTTQK